MAKKTIDSIIYPVKTKRGIKFGKEKKMLSSEAIASQTQKQKTSKLLDGFLLLFSCRVILPHEAIRSKLASS